MADIATLGIRVTSQGLADANRDLSRLEDSGRRAEGATKGVSSAFGALKTAIAALGVGVAIREFVQAADQMSLLNARLKLATGSTQEFTAAQRALFALAQQNSVGIAETIQLYTRLAEPIKRVGGGMTEVIGITDTFQKALQLGGVSAQEAAAATLQFGQALGRGALSGDEFNSIAEASPRILKAIADGAGLPIEKLKELGAEGELTSDVIGNALMNVRRQVETEFASLPDTVGKAMTRLQNDTLKAISEINSAGGLTSVFSDGIDSLRDLIPGIKDELVGAAMSLAEWMERNRGEFGAIFDIAVGLTGNVWDLAKGAAAVVGFIADWAVQSGVVRTVIETISLMVAGVQDGVRLIGGGFALVGATILDFVVGAFRPFAEGVADIAEWLGLDIAKPFREAADSLGGVATGARAYADSVFSAFSSGDTAVQRTIKSFDEAGKKTVEAGKKAATTDGEYKRLAKTTNDTAAATEKVAAATNKYGKYLRDLLNKEIEKTIKAQEDLIRRYADVTGPLEDQALALEDESRNYGKTAAQIAATTVERYEEVRAMAAKNGASPEYLANLDREIDARKRIRDAMEDIEAKQATDDAAKKAKDEWQRTADSIEQSLTDALMRGFESGEGFGENFKRTLINMFKTLVLRPIIQPIAQGMAGAVMGQMGNTALGLAGMGGVGGGGGFNMPTTGIGSSGLINGIAGSSLLAGTSAGAFGAGVASGLASWTTAGATVGATAGAGAAAGGAVGAGMMVGTAIPIVGIVLAILAAIDWGGGTPHAGAVVFSDENGDTTSPRTLEEARAQYANPEDVAGFTYSDYFRRREQGVADALEPIASGAATLINDTLEAFGQQAGYRVGVSFSSDRDDPSRGAFSLIDSAGGEVSEFARKYARKAEDAIPQLVGDIGVELRDFLVEQLPDWADDMLNALGDKPSMEALSATVAQVTAIRDAAEELNPIFGTTAESFIAIANKAGGIDQALQALNAYADLSMSSSEKWRAAQDALGRAFDRIGQTVPQSTAEFERMMRGIDQTTEAGQTLYASMLGLAPAFYSIAGAVEAVFESISKSAAQIVNDFAYDVMNDEQRYAFLDATLDAKLAEIREATEPGEIGRLVEEAFATQRSAWQLLSEDERRRLLPEFQNDALEIEAIGQSRLSVTPVDSPEAQQAREAADERSAQRMQQAVADGITQGFAPVIAAMQQGNIDQSEALGMVAETIASLPGRIQIVTSEVGMI